MDRSALKELVLKRLANHIRISDVAQEVCERSGMYWDEAEAFVREIAEQEEHSIRKKRSPMVVALAVVTFVGGLALLMATIFSVSSVIVFYRSTQPEVLSTINILLLIANEASLAIWLGALGLAMMAGSMIGMRDIWIDWLR